MLDALLKNARYVVFVVIITHDVVVNKRTRRRGQICQFSQCPSVLKKKIRQIQELTLAAKIVHGAYKFWWRTRPMRFDAIMFQAPVPAVADQHRFWNSRNQTNLSARKRGCCSLGAMQKEWKMLFLCSCTEELHGHTITNPTPLSEFVTTALDRLSTCRSSNDISHPAGHPIISLFSHTAHMSLSQWGFFRNWDFYQHIFVSHSAFSRAGQMLKWRVFHPLYPVVPELSKSVLADALSPCSQRLELTFTQICAVSWTCVILQLTSCMSCDAWLKER